MSLTIEVTVHCDRCGRWLYTKQATAAQRRRWGWTTNGAAAQSPVRRDYCPLCSRLRATETETGK